MDITTTNTTDKVTKTKGAMMALKDFEGKVKSAVDEHLTLGLTIAAIFGVGAIVKFMWDEAPKAQEAIAKKKEVDPNASGLELAAVAFPHLKKTVIAVTATGGVIILHQYISDARLAAATAFGAAAFTDKKTLEKKLEELTGKDKAAEVKAEMHNATTSDPNATEEATVLEGEPVNSTFVAKEKQDMYLNKIYKFEIDWDNSVVYTTPMNVEETNKYIREHYGKSHLTNWQGKPFSMETVGHLLGRNFGDMGRMLGYPDGDDFEISYSPAYDKETGEMFFIMTLPEPTMDWELPFA